MKLFQHLHLLIPSLRSSAIKPEEEALRVALEDIEMDVKRRGIGSGRMRARLSELWALVSALQAARDREKSAGISGVEWAVVDEEGLAQVTQVSGSVPVQTWSLSCSLPRTPGSKRATGWLGTFDEGATEGS
jgi:nuclear pore complex protein Nup54